MKPLKCAESYVDISDEDNCIINYSRKSLLFNNQQAWIKWKKRKWILRRNYGCIRRRRECELVGSSLLHQLSKKYNKKDIGLYQENGLAVS